MNICTIRLCVRGKMNIHKIGCYIVYWQIGIGDISFCELIRPRLAIRQWLFEYRIWYIFEHSSNYPQHLPGISLKTISNIFVEIGLVVFESINIRTALPFIVYSDNRKQIKYYFVLYKNNSIATNDGSEKYFP